MEEIEKYLEVGRVSCRIREKVQKILERERNIKCIANRIEEEIRKEGCEPAFPVNIGIDDIAAHYTPTIDEKAKIEENNLVKIDIGLHKDGFIADFALSFTENEELKELIDVAKKACIEGCKMAKPGTKVMEISEVIEKEIKEKGFSPISNLTGHGLKRYEINAKPAIPNVSCNIGYELKENEVIAIEPFVSRNCNWVKEEKVGVIFSVSEFKNVRNEAAREIMKMCKQRNFLPVCERWLEGKFSQIKIRLGIKELKERGLLVEYPILRGSDIIAQWENSVIVRDKPIVFTENID